MNNFFGAHSREMVIDCHYNKHFLNELYLEEKIQLSRFFVSSSYFPFEIYECQLITTLPGRIRKDLQENVLLLIFSCNYELHTSRSSVNFHFQWRRTQTIFSFVFISKWNSARLRCNKTALFSLSLSLSLPPYHCYVLSNTFVEFKSLAHRMA